MAAAAVHPARQDAHAQFHYLYHDQNGYQPSVIYADPSLGENKEIHDTQPVTVHDITGEEEMYTLDGHGFQLVDHVANEKDFVDEKAITGAYYDELDALVKKVTGASRVFLFDYALRGPLKNPAKKTRDPIFSVHADQSDTAGPDALARLLPDEAERLSRSRYQIINLWRPIRAPVQRDPLAIADYKTVSEDDLVPTPIAYPTRQGSIVLVKHSEKHKWYYKKGITPEQLYFIKCYDSKRDGRSRRAAHSAFVDPSVPEDAPPRESIEVRCFVFHEDDME